MTQLIPRLQSTLGPGPTQLLVIQATPFCNINCDYCYLPNRGDRQRISRATLFKIFEQVFRLPYVNDELSVVWHAGEPLVLPVSFYRDAALIAGECNRARQIAVTHNFQTNGIGLDPHWCDLFKEIPSRIGISIDGPRAIHDKHRKTKAGKPTFDLVMAGIGQLRDAGVPFTTISVVTHDSLGRAEEIVEFLHGIGSLQIGFNIEEIEGPHVDSSLRSDSEGALERFFRAADRAAYRLGIPIREFNGLRALRVEKPMSMLSFQATPLTMINVDVSGNVSTFSPELLGISDALYGSFSFLNVHSGDICQLLQDARFGAVFGDIVHGVEQCRRSCEYFVYCAGGAPANKLFENGTFRSTETLYCRAHVKSIVRALDLPTIEPNKEYISPK